MNEAYRSLRTRQELRRAAAEILKPLVPCMTPGKARIYVSQGSAHYAEDVAGMECHLITRTNFRYCPTCRSRS